MNYLLNDDPVEWSRFPFLLSMYFICILNAFFTLISKIFIERIAMSVT